MDMGTHRFRVGTFDCVAVNDGSARTSVAGLIARAVPRDRLAEALRAHRLDLDHDEVEVAYNCVVVDTGETRVLVDTGSGASTDGVGMLVPRLRSVAIEPAGIDTLVLSHVHPDHIGGLTDAGGALAFPNARYVVSAAEWEFWMGEDPDLTRFDGDGETKQSLISVAREGLAAIRDRLTLLGDGAEIAPGVSAVLAPGHTPGHMAVAVHSAGESLLITGDAAYHPVHFEHPTWYTPFDTQPDRVAETRRHLLQWATTRHALILAYHFPFPGLGHMRPQGEEWQWEPVLSGGIDR